MEQSALQERATVYGQDSEGEQTVINLSDTRKESRIPAIRPCVSAMKASARRTSCTGDDVADGDVGSDVDYGGIPTGTMTGIAAAILPTTIVMTFHVDWESERDVHQTPPGSGGAPREESNSLGDTRTGEELGGDKATVPEGIRPGFTCLIALQSLAPVRLRGCPSKSWHLDDPHSLGRLLRLRGAGKSGVLASFAGTFGYRVQTASFSRRPLGQ